MVRQRDDQTDRKWKFHRTNSLHAAPHYKPAHITEPSNHITPHYTVNEADNDCP